MISSPEIRIEFPESFLFWSDSSRSRNCLKGEVIKAWSLIQLEGAALGARYPENDDFAGFPRKILPTADQARASMFNYFAHILAGSLPLYLETNYFKVETEVLFVQQSTVEVRRNTRRIISQFSSSRSFGSALIYQGKLPAISEQPLTRPISHHSRVFPCMRAYH